MLIAVFDLTEGWSFQGEPDVDFGIRFSNGNANRMRFEALAFGWTLLVNGSEKSNESWPPSNIVIRELTSSRVFSYKVDANPDDEVTLVVWARNSGATFKSETAFTVPRPPQPYPSWAWQDGAWAAPVPYPDGDGFYSWDEDAQEWATFDPISEQGED